MDPLTDTRPPLGTRLLGKIITNKALLCRLLDFDLLGEAPPLTVPNIQKMYINSTRLVKCAVIVFVLLNSLSLSKLSSYSNIHSH